MIKYIIRVLGSERYLCWAQQTSEEPNYTGSKFKFCNFATHSHFIVEFDSIEEACNACAEQYEQTEIVTIYKN